jgi:hypothetical protein
MPGPGELWFTKDHVYFIYLFCAVLGFELRAYTLSYATKPFF